MTTTFVLKVELNNAAFQDEPGELARILRRLAARLEDVPPVPFDAGTVSDTNGNRVGTWGVDVDDEGEGDEGHDLDCDVHLKPDN